MSLRIVDLPDARPTGDADELACRDADVDVLAGLDPLAELVYREGL